MRKAAPSAHPGKRISVIGTAGSGKTTFARRLSVALGYPCTELDALNWGPDWTMVPLEEFQAAVEAVIAGNCWVIDGNYRSRLGELVWGRADTLIWLDYALPVILWRLWWRTLRRTVAREELWNGNRESLRSQFFTSDSLFLWTFKSHARHRRQYPASLAEPENAHLALIRFHTPHEANRWLTDLEGTLHV